MPTWLACVPASASIGARKCEKLTRVVDAGTIVYPDGALVQVEGAALWGASLALHEGSEFVTGRVKDTNLDTYTPPAYGRRAGDGRRIPAQHRGAD